MNREHDNPAKQEFSDEFLNAFLDNQLTLEEKDRAYLRISQDETLNRRVCELRKIQDMVRLSYQNSPPPPARPAPVNSHGRLGLGLAASIALTVGIALGWALHEPASRPVAVQLAGTPLLTQSTVTPTAPLTLAKASAAVAAHRMEIPVTAAVNEMLSAPTIGGVPVATAPPADATAAQTKVLIQVNSAGAINQRHALNEIENLLRHYRDTGVNARLEVVINGDGLGLVRADASPHAKRIERLLQEYENLTFAACFNTIERLKREQGVTTRLLPGVIVIDSGVAQIMRRQQQGWAYIQV
ncbi:MAG TPA: hypothetical protein VJB18_07100 [Burkholderiales bacterium]|nr:hypothetical protein [Burkholderiales bacterium]